MSLVSREEIPQCAVEGCNGRSVGFSGLCSKHFDTTEREHP